MNATRYDRAESVVVFYNATTGEKVTKFVKNLLHLCAQGEFCALVTRVDEEVAAAAVQQYLIILCNAIGSPVEIKCAQSSRLSPYVSFPNVCTLRYMQIEPKLTCMTLTHLIVTSDSAVYSWQCAPPCPTTPAVLPLIRASQIPVAIFSPHSRRQSKSNARCEHFVPHLSYPTSPPSC